MTGIRALAWVVMGLLLAEGVALAQQAPPPTPPWSKFVRTRAHALPIPAQWVETPEGEFAHDIVLPDSIPKTVPFDFEEAKKKAKRSGGKTVSRQYWEHLCATEAGSFVLKTVENVDGFFFMRAVVGLGDQDNNSRWKAEAPGMESNAPTIWRASNVEEAFVYPPFSTYKWVDGPADTRGLVRLYGKPPRRAANAGDPVAASDAAYGLTWRGIRRERDRELAVAGFEWIAVDRRTGEVLGVLRDFNITGLTRNWAEGVFWLNAGRCPVITDLLGPLGDFAQASHWIPMVLRPAVYPGVLKFLDQRKREIR